MRSWLRAGVFPLYSVFFFIALELLFACAEIESLPPDLNEHIRLVCGQEVSGEYFRHCVMREKKKLEIKADLIDALNVRSSVRQKPKLNHRQIQQLLLVEGFTSDGFMIGSEYHNGVATARVLPVVQSPSHLAPEPLRTWVDVSSLDNMTRVDDVELFFYLREFPANKKEVVQYTITLYKYIDDTEIDLVPVEVIKRVKTAKQNMKFLGDFERISIDYLVKEWRRNPTSNYGLMVKVDVEDPLLPIGIDFVDRYNPENQVRTISLAGDLRVSGLAWRKKSLSTQLAGCLI
uniref:TGFb_propeptide domain-containing protein n=1 Tax=Heterorhabditis bacteriophora TaxID=37862 RepID=A0A1I7XN26_HETBA